MSVYAANDTPNADENRPRSPPPIRPTSRADQNFPRLYGPLKALFGTEVQKGVRRSTQRFIRPGLIVGSRRRLRPLHLLARAALPKAARCWAPPRTIRCSSSMRADLGEWAIRCCENKPTASFNADGPAKAVHG